MASSMRLVVREFMSEDGAGRIVLTYVDRSEITLYGFYPNPGWVHEVERDGPRAVKLKSFNIRTEREGEWKAQIEDDGIQVEN